MEATSAVPENACVVLLFGAAREAIGRDRVELQMAMPTTARSLKEELIKQWPVLRSLVTRSRIAVDNRLVDDEHGIAASSEVALIPPVSGG